MKKREFLKSAAKLAALAPVGAIAADNRRFGVPASVEPKDPALANKIRLTLARMSLPTAAWDEMLNFTLGLQALVDSETAKSQFSKSPRAYFDAVGVKTSPQFDSSSEVAMARLVMDETAKFAASSGDYATFMRRIQEFHLPVIPDSQGLTASIVKIMRDDINLYERVKAKIDSTGINKPQTVIDELTGLGTHAKAGPLEETAYVESNTIVFVDVFLISHVSVAAELIAISAVAVAVILIVAGQEIKKAGHGQISKLDNRMVEGASTAITAARLLGNKGFEIKIATDVVHREVEAVFFAAESVGLLRINAQDRESILAECKIAAERSLGIAP